jgi:hypothetical protein
MQTKDWHQYHEREYWYGPKFNHNIPHNKQEVTKYTSSFIEKCANGSAFTEYYWKRKKMDLSTRDRRTYRDRTSEH